MRKVRRLFYLFMLCAAPFCGKAQELNARITVNGDKIATANKQIFTTLQNSLTEFVNNRKWTDATFAVNEKWMRRTSRARSRYKLAVRSIIPVIQLLF
ncbi:MAG: DUF4835 family protein [Parabacteroides distasonis]|nr:DUF4835 family protein [Parabacteroides distasonis]